MHNAIVKFRKKPDIRNHFAENRANNKDNAPDAAGSPFRIRTRPPPIPAGALGHDSAPPCRKDGRRRMRSTAPRPYRRSPARQPETGGFRGRYGRRSREGALPPERGRGACRPGRPVRPAPSWAPRRASRPASESRSCPRCSRNARCSPATSAAAVWRVRA